ncbi:filamentous hemagglutinin [uncultured Mediterranean phage uvMED]|nr:filamentous hemagglutinin [uncultured Mediterranean phage uvMED]
MANYTSTHTGAVIDASVTIISGSGVTQSDLTKLNAVTSSAVELNLLDGVTATTAELNILDGATLSVTELNYLDGADSSITTLSLPDNTTITTFGASLIDDADAASARTTLGVDVAGTDNSTDVTLVTTSHDYLSLSGQAITLGQIDISDDTNLVGGDGLALTGDTLSVNVDDSSIEINSDTLRVKASGVTNAMLAGSIVNAKLSNSSVSYGGVSVALGSSDATPAFDLSDATSLPIVEGTTGTLSVARGGTGSTTASGARSNLNVDVAGTDNSTDVTLVTTSYDYLSLSGQAITLGQIDISDDTNLVGGTGITLTGDTLSTTDSEIVHDNLSGFVANEHIDHSGVSITAGAGLTGGGDITSTRDIAVGAGTGVTVNANDVAIGQDVATSADVEFNSVTADIIGDIRGATKFSAKADAALNKGDAVYISGISGNTPTVDIADSNDAAKMPSFGLAGSSVSANGSVEIFTFGTLSGLNTSSFSVGDILYVSTNGTSGNTLTATKPTGESSLLQNIGTVQRSHASAGSIKVGGAGRTNATPNLDDGDIFIGNGSNQAVSASLNTKIESYLDGGTSTANFDTISVDGVEITATPAELNKMDGVTSTTAELNYTDGVTSNIQTQLDLKAPLASPGFSGTATGVNLTLSGDLTVNGSTTTLDTTNIAVEDNLMELNSGVTSNANDAGIIIERGSTGDNAIFMWDESADKFTLGTTSANADSTGNISITTGTLVASSFEGAVTGNVTGNADTATTLATARNFSLTGDVTAGAVSFDGSGNVALATTIAANSVALGTDTTGNYMSDLTEGTGIDISHTPAEGSNGTITLDLTEVGFGGGANRLITDDGDGTVSTEANLTFDGSTLALTGTLTSTGHLKIADGQAYMAGGGEDVQLFHSDTYGGFLFNQTNHFFFDQVAADKDWIFRVDDSDGGGDYQEVMRIQGSTQNVGIGTNSPSKKFVVKGASGDQARFEHNGAVGSVDIYSGTDGGLINVRNASGTSILELDGRSGNLELPYGRITDAGTDMNIVSDNALTLGTESGTALTFANASLRGVFADDVSIPVAKKLYFGGGDHTYIGEDVDDRLRFFVGGDEFMRFTQQDAGGELFSIYQDVYIPDDKKIHFGAGNDLKLHHDATHSYIQNSTGNLYIQSNEADKDLVLQCDDGSGGTTAYLTLNGSASLIDFDKASRYMDSVWAYFGTGLDFKVGHDGSNAYIANDTTGDLYIQNDLADRDVILRSDDGAGGVAAYLTLDGSAGFTKANKHIKFLDGQQVMVGDSADAIFYHDGSNTWLDHSGTGNFHIRNQKDDQDLILSCDDGSGGVAAYLTLDGSSAITTVHKIMRFDDSIDLRLGAGSDLRLYHNGTNSYVDNYTGDLYIRNNNNDKDIILQSDDGSGGVTPYITLDGSATNVDVAQHLRIPSDSKQLKLGASDDLLIYHDGSNSSVQNGTGALFINNVANASLHLNTNNTTAMTINNSQNVGIGTSSLGAGAKLNVVSGSSAYTAQFSRLDADDGLFLHSEAAGTHYNWLISTQDNVDAGFEITPSTGVGNRTFSTPAFVIKADTGNVGIGTQSPSHEMVLRKDQAAETELSIVNLTSNSSAKTNLRFRNATSGSETGNGGLIQLTNGNDFKILNQFGNNLILGTSNAEKMRITGAGNVGIGTTSPGAKFTVLKDGTQASSVSTTYQIQTVSNSNGGIAIQAGDSSHAYLVFGDNGDYDAGKIGYENANHNLKFFTNNAQKLLLNTDGDLLPEGDGTQDLGASSKRWGVIYSADLDLSNEGSENDVDGTWGSYVIQEGEDDLFLINRRSGKKYKFMLQEVQD